jgi:hypothetical protein
MNIVETTLSALELERIAPMREAVKITSLSQDTLERRYNHLIRKISPRRKGIRVRDLLAIAAGRAEVA